MNRRGFLGAILVAGVAPAIVRADSLMRIVPRDTRIIGVDLALHDDALVVWKSRGMGWTEVREVWRRLPAGGFVVDVCGPGLLTRELRATCPFLPFQPEAR